MDKNLLQVLNTMALQQGGDHHHSHSHNHNVNVQNHQAPTAEVAKMLDEMREAARKDVVATIPVPFDSLGFTAVIQIAKQPLRMNGYSVLAVFQLNNSRHEAEFQYEGMDKPSIQELLFGIRDAVAKHIANQLDDAVHKALHEAQAILLYDNLQWAKNPKQ